MQTQPVFLLLALFSDFLFFFRIMNAEVSFYASKPWLLKLRPSANMQPEPLCFTADQVSPRQAAAFTAAWKFKGRLF
jgi:hypothetical protein